MTLINILFFPTIRFLILILLAERSLEDHEDVLKVYASWSPQKEGSEQENRFIFKQDFCKYEFFRTPQVFCFLIFSNNFYLN